ncbi:MAG: VWA domain-containing protein [Candidatus Brocadiae bacterium]|nr:VWA domain-containing protein [Candidatus Brocadiia bacterium]
MKRLLSAILILMGLSFAYSCRIVPVPPPDIVRPAVELQKIQVRQHHFQVTIQDGVATTVLETVFYNPNPRILEGTYLFPLPKGASVSQFSMWIDGKEMKGELLDAQKARDLYVSIVRRMIDPGLLEFVGRETFKMQIFPIPANGEKKIKLTYQHLLPKDGSLMQYVYPLTTVGNGREDTLGKLSFQINISSQIPIQSIFSPSHKVKVVKEENKATVSFEEEKAHPDRDFTLYLSSSDKKVDLSFVPFRQEEGEKGYFLLMLSPKAKNEEIQAKDMVFLFDTSGSMLAGNKIEQAKEALKYCLKSLRKEDRFNIVTFSTTVKRYQTESNLIEASKENIEKAVSFVDSKVYASGATNIEDGLSVALSMASRDSKRPFMLFFLTDGRPTIGATDTESILAVAKKANLPNLRLFAFGVGVDLNAKLLDAMAEQNRGAQEYVGEKEDIELKVSNLFDKVSSPVLTDISIEFPSSKETKIMDVYPKNFPDLFKGAQVNLVGRYSGKGDQVIRLKGRIGEEEQTFDYEVSFPEKNIENSQIPRLWATRKIGFLLEQIRLEGAESHLKKEVVDLAQEFGIVTPYTSYLVLEDDAQISQRPPTPRPGVWQAPSSTSTQDVSRQKEMEYAKKSMATESGKDAVETSRWIKGAKEADVAYESPKSESKSKAKADSMIKKIDDKTFYLKDKIWQDSIYQGKEKKIRIRYMSEEYLKLLTEKAAIGKYLALGPKVIVVWENVAYEIYND